jgi:peptidoglycan/xylan/chitin deacetylase (PgdA/CDA1 family)
VTKTVSFCFDDGFLSSTEKTARLFEARGLRASFCIMAAPDRSADTAHVDARFADWPLWRELRGRGHDIAPHGWAHERLGALTHDAACASITRMFARFATELPGFAAERAIFHTPYLSMPPRLVDWLLVRCAAVRIAQGGAGITRQAAAQRSRQIDCITFGPDDVAAQAATRIDGFRDADGDWLVLVLHGVDGEGWGSLAVAELAALVVRCQDAGLNIRPLAEILLPRSTIE